MCVPSVKCDLSGIAYKEPPWGKGRAGRFLPYWCMRSFLHHVGRLYSHTSRFLYIINTNTVLVLRRVGGFMSWNFRVWGGGYLIGLFKAGLHHFLLLCEVSSCHAGRKGGVETFSELEGWWVRNGHYLQHTTFPTTSETTLHSHTSCTSHSTPSKHAYTVIFCLRLSVVI